MSISCNNALTHISQLDAELSWEQVEAKSSCDKSDYFHWKGIVDRLLACLLLLPGLPLMGLLIVVVRLTSRGPGIYRQIRVGKNGAIFMMYKIRSMKLNAEARTGAVWTTGNDARITRVGRVLRTLHLDELPQLINVLKGEMSLIGPRPERPEFVVILAQEIPGYMRRMSVLPGITGLAQINLPPDTDLNSVRRKQALDLEYIETANLYLECRMLLCTFLRIVGIKGDIAMSVMGVRRDVTLPIIPRIAADSEGPATDLGSATPEAIASQAGQISPC